MSINYQKKLKLLKLRGNFHLSQITTIINMDKNQEALKHIESAISKLLKASKIIQNASYDLEQAHKILFENKKKYDYKEQNFTSKMAYVNLVERFTYIAIEHIKQQIKVEQHENTRN